MKKLTKKQKTFIFIVLTFAAFWAAGIKGFLVILVLFLVAFLVDKKKKK